jgi:hypothetical protein
MDAFRIAACFHCIPLPKHNVVFCLETVNVISTLNFLSPPSVEARYSHFSIYAVDEFLKNAS